CPVDDREVVLGDEIGLAQGFQIGLDADAAKRALQALPAFGMQFDQRVIKIEGNEFDRAVVGSRLRVHVADWCPSSVQASSSRKRGMTSVARRLADSSPSPPRGKSKRNWLVPAAR